MAFNPKVQCFLLLLLVFTLLNSSSSLSVYEILPEYGLPSGLLPDSVTNYTLSQDGNFEVYLEKPCYTQFDYTVYYDKKITGKLSLGSIKDLKGIQVQKFFFLWLDVDQIKVDLPPTNSIYFTVGIINKKLDLDQFKKVRSCKAKALTLTQQFLEFPAVVDEVPMLITE